MYALRRYAVRHARLFEGLYNALERALVALDPLFLTLGYNRLERPVAAVERTIKGLLFDCQMCGQCVLSSTGMSCPMNCPKNLRNGPCGGVRGDGMCEVKPQMRCVWLEALEGANRMKWGVQRIEVVQPPVNRELKGSSSWLRVVREKAAERREARRSTDRSKQALARAFEQARMTEPASAPLTVEPQAALADQAVKENTTVFETERTG
jgi:hypothetical protein